MDHDASIARAKFIDQSVETRQAFSFASPAEIIRALQVYNSSHYGSMLWDMEGEAACQYFNSWNTAIKLAWDRPSKSWHVVPCGTSSSMTDILARYSKFFKGLCNKPSREVAVLANLIARDRRSVTGIMFSWLC